MLLVLAAAAAGLTVGAAVAGALTSVSVSFTEPGCHEWTPPSELASAIEIEAFGSAGEGVEAVKGGSGDRFTATLAKPLEPLTVCVDVGGGAGGEIPFAAKGGSGGGYSGVGYGQQGAGFQVPLVVAAGGGGAGAYGSGEEGAGGDAQDSGHQGPGTFGAHGGSGGGGAVGEGYGGGGAEGGAQGTFYEGGAGGTYMLPDRYNGPGGGGGAGFRGGGGGGAGLAPSSEDFGGGGGGGGSDYCNAQQLEGCTRHAGADTSAATKGVTLSYQTAPPPTILPHVPAEGVCYHVGEAIAVEYGCASEAGLEPGKLGCEGTQPVSTLLETAVGGEFTFTITARSKDGQTTTKVIHYSVVGAPPTIAIANPAPSSVYAVAEPEQAHFTCADGEKGPGLRAGVEGCEGSVAYGDALDTGEAGTFTLTVTARSKDGLSTSRSVSYEVSQAARFRLFDSAGCQQWPVADGAVRVQAIGDAGAEGAASEGAPAGTGGAGDEVSAVLSGLRGDEALDVCVGVGGAAGGSGGLASGGSGGGASGVALGASFAAPLLLAGGGGGGGGAGESEAGAAGGGAGLPEGASGAKAGGGALGGGGGAQTQLENGGSGYYADPGAPGARSGKLGPGSGGTGGSASTASGSGGGGGGGGYSGGGGGGGDRGGPGAGGGGGSDHCVDGASVADCTVGTGAGSSITAARVLLTWLPAPMKAATEPAAQVLAFSATLEGSVNPAAAQIEGCRFEYGTSTEYTGALPCEALPPPGEGQEPVSARIAHLSPGTTYHFRVVVRSGGETIDGSDRSFQTPAATAPEVQALEAPEPDQTTATIKAQVDPEGVGLLSCRVEYGTSLPSSSSAPCTSAIPASVSFQPVEASLPGLTAGTRYEARLLVRNDAGATSSEPIELETAPFATPQAHTSPIPVQQQFTATLAGSVETRGATLTACRFEYGPTSSYGKVVACQHAPAPAPAGSAAVTAKIGALRPHTRYHFRLSVSAASGSSSGGEEEFQTSPAAAPVIDGEPASEVVQTQARLNAQVNPEGAEITACRFEYGTSTALGHTLACPTRFGTSQTPVPVSAVALKLFTGQTYYFRLMAGSPSGTAKGPIGHFTALPPAGPQALTEEATSVLQASAVLNGLVDPFGAPITGCLFAYGNTPALGSSAPCSSKPAPVLEEVPVSGALKGLSPATTYYYALVATNAPTNETRTSRGEEETFTTLPVLAPVAETVGASELAAGSATLTGTVDPRGAEVSKCLFEYGTSAAYGQSVECERLPGDGTAPVDVAAPVTGLAAGQTYHFRLVARSSGGEALGADVTFTAE